MDGLWWKKTDSTIETEDNPSIDREESDDDFIPSRNEVNCTLNIKSPSSRKLLGGI
jgi:hypothetical protein